MNVHTRICAGSLCLMLLLACAEIFCRYMDYAVCIDIEGDLNLRYSARCRSDTFKVECPERPVLGSKLTLALENMDGHSCLTIACRGEDLALPGRNRRVPLDQLRADTAERLDTERKRCDIQKKNILYVSLEDAALDGCAYSNDLIRVYSLVRLLAEKLLDEGLNARDPG